MIMPARVMLIGQDEARLETIAVVLRHFWIVRKSAMDRSALADVDTELLVVSDSMEEPVRQEWVESLRTKYPYMLIIKMNGYDSGPHAGADATVDTVHGPGALVSTIYELLTERGLPSRAWPTTDELPWIQ